MNPSSTNCARKWGFLVPTVPLPRSIDSKWGLAYALAQKGCGNSHYREFDLRSDKFAYQGNIQRIATALQYLAVLSLIGFIGYAGWFWTELSTINKEIASLEEDLVSQIKETMPDLPSSVMSNPSTVVSLMQEEITVATDKLDKLGSITADEPHINTGQSDIGRHAAPRRKPELTSMKW